MKIIKIDRLPIAGDYIQVIPLDVYEKISHSDLNKDIAGKKLRITAIFYNHPNFNKNTNTMIKVIVIIYILMNLY